MADLQRALEIAVTAHRGQLQRSGLPYVLHPLQLMFQVDDPDARICAVLHDVVEDTEWELDGLRAEGFSDSVLAALDCLTHREGEPYADYVERIATNPVARQVKLADLRHNIDLLRLPEVRKTDLQRLERYHQAWLRLGGPVLP
ncbi:MAG: bifunctional (p)ppGpp synthetase/guanosine-3',5'-bis(diphosphate) 3'-pyrophosphohydrolase [Planctomycetes bacterium]|nr:bifunctional (p)ppGpp synthetase/guanosine-3',5'-bis(diphosphate) 3'-pyrophosphohydrolase [Planctomycetota bacterium]